MEQRFKLQCNDCSIETEITIISDEYIDELSACPICGSSDIESEESEE